VRYKSLEFGILAADFDKRESVMRGNLGLRPANAALLLLLQLLQNCATPVQSFASPVMQLPGFGPPSPGEILSRVAEVGLKLKLARHRGVAVDVTASPAKILGGSTPSAPSSYQN